MKTRVAIWASAGFLAAGAWAIYAILTAPESFLASLREPVVRAALYLSCPIYYFARHYPISLRLFLLMNAATYGVAGLVLEVFRLKSKPSLAA